MKDEDGQANCLLPAAYCLLLPVHWRLLTVDWRLSYLQQWVRLTAHSRPPAIEVVRKRTAANRAESVLFAEVFNGDNCGHCSSSKLKVES